MRRPRTPTAETHLGRRLAVRVTIAATLGVALTGSCIAFVVRGFFVHAEEERAAAHAQLLTRAVLANTLRVGDLGHPAAARVVQLEHLLRRQVIGSDTVAATVYAADGRLIASTEQTDAGRSTPDSAAVVRQALTHASSSRVVRRTLDGRTREVFEQTVPFRLGGRSPAGVAVLSYDYPTLVHAASRGFTPVAAVLALLLLVPFLVLVPVAMRAIRQARKHLDDAQSFALRDMLTGLPNRRLFEDRVLHALAQSHRDGRGAAVMLLDLNRFKEINDTFGHAAGDAVLREIALRLSSVLRRADTVARFGGDEFAVVVSGSGLDTVRDAARRMSQAIEAPVRHDGISLCLGASIGVALHPYHGTTAAALLKYADVAMYQAKRAGLGWVVYDPESTAGDAERLALAADLAGALGRAEMVVHYQPTVELNSGETVGVEALLRWEHPTKGLLPAERFMPLADQAGVRAELHEFALVEAITQAGVWRRRGSETTVAINLDGRSIVDPDLPSRIEHLLAEHGVDPERIEAEIAEASLLSDVKRVRSIAIELAAAGIALVIDDFGADHSSLDSLAHLPVEKLKVGRSFLARASSSRRELIVLGGIVGLAHDLGLGVVVAGVENDEELALVRDLQADYVQGYHVGAPMNAAALDPLLAPSPKAAAL